MAQAREFPMATASSPQVVRFGVFELDLQSRELRKQGLKVKVQEQPFCVLEILLRHPGELVTREELRQKTWSADTFVDFELGLNTAINRLRHALGDSADNPRFVETLPRRGYRFIAPVDVGAGPAAGGMPAQQGHAQGVPLPHPAVGAVRDRIRIGRVGRMQSLAVLPLEDLSSDKEQEYFADGMTDELITELGKIGALRVISRTSVMQYKATRKPLGEIAGKLKVDAVVEGTVLRSGNRVRITAQLIRAAREKHLWAESYQGELSDLLALQAKVARAIASEIRVRLTPQEQARSAPRLDR